jgi:hypothetical protein
MEKFYCTESFKKFYLFIFFSVPLWPVFFKRLVFIEGEAQEVKGWAMNQREQKYKQWIEILNHMHADYTRSHREKER